jgi:hypothetical protein
LDCDLRWNAVLVVLMGFNPLSQGAVFQGSSRQTQTLYQNGTGSTAPAATAVSQGTGNNFVLTDVTNETTVEAFVGLTSASIPNSASGLINSDGRLENIPLGLGFSIGDPIWVGLTPGSLTNVKPDLSVPGWAAGMFVIFIGVVVQNQFNPSNQDIQLLKQIVGQF